MVDEIQKLRDRRNKMQERMDRLADGERANGNMITDLSRSQKMMFLDYKKKIEKETIKQMERLQQLIDDARAATKKYKAQVEELTAELEKLRNG